MCNIGAESHADVQNERTRLHPKISITSSIRDDYAIISTYNGDMVNMMNIGDMGDMGDMGTWGTWGT